jgi:N-acetylglucosamine-6-phosphate deacetylase
LSLRKEENQMFLNGKLPEDDRMITLHVEGNKIAQIEPFLPGPGQGGVGSDLFISTGFFDPQVNGFAGIDFNDKNLMPEDVHRAAQSISATGVTTFFPTLITTSFERLVHQLKILKKAMEEDWLVSNICKGIHLEGPYISSKEGPRGIHPLPFIRSPRWDEFEKFQEACGGRIKLITLAPEKEGALDFIEKAVSKGVVVSIGHTAASEDILEDGWKAGARLSTHLGNGMGRSFDRYRNPFQKQLSMDGLMASIIADGIHLPDYVVKNIVRTKGPEHIVLCTDAVSAAAQPPGRYRLADFELDTEGNGRTRLAGTDTLAGSTLSIPKAITNVIKFAGTDLGTSVRMAAENGRKLFPEMIGTLSPGQPADLVLFRWNEGLMIERTLLMGQEVFSISNSKSQISNTK